MGFEKKATNGVATRAEGALTHCGPGNGLELSYSCQGPSCSSLDGSIQNVICHRDGSSTLVCSNDVKCQPGISTYHSNFTFTQNEPDPWSPTMENHPDIWVPQEQHVMVGGCAKFSLVSDGTGKGTHVVDTADTCQHVQYFSTPSAISTYDAISSGRTHVVTTQKPLVLAGTSSKSNVFRSSLLFTVMLTFILLLPEAHASIDHRPHEEIRRANALHTRTAFDGPKTFASRLRTELAERANSHGADGEAFANSLLANIVSSSCRQEGSSTDAFKSEIFKNCIVSIYNGEQLPQPALRFLAVFGGSALCNYVISETFPSGQAFVPDTCNELQNLLDEVRTGAASSVAPSRTAAVPSASRIGSPGVFLPILSSTIVRISSQASSALLLQGSSSPRLWSSQILYTDPASTTAHPSSAPSSRSSTSPVALDSVIPSDALSSADSRTSLSSTTFASLLESTRPLDTQESLAQATEKVIPEASRTETTQLPMRSDLLGSGETSPMAPSRAEQGDSVRISSSMLIQETSAQGQSSTAPVQSDVSKAPSFVVSPGVTPSMLAQDVYSLPFANAYAVAVSSPTIALSGVYSALLISSPFHLASDRWLVEVSKVDTSRHIGLSSARSTHSAPLPSATSSGVLSLNEGSAGDQETVEMVSNDLIPALQPSRTTGISVGEQAVASSFTSSMAVGFVSGNRLSRPPPLTEILQRPGPLTTSMILEAAFAASSYSGKPHSFAPADRSTDTQSVNDYSLTSNSRDTYQATHSDISTSTVAISALSVSMTTSVVAVSLTLVAASHSDPALLNPFSILSHKVGAKTSISSTGIAGSDSKSWPVASTFAASPVTVPPAAVPSRTFMTSTASSNSATERRSSLSAVRSFGNSTNQGSESSSFGLGSSPLQVKPTAPWTSAISTIASDFINPVSTSDRKTEHPSTSISSQELAAASSLVNMGVAFGILDPGSFTLSPTQSTAPATVPYGLSPSAATASQSSNGSTPRIEFGSMPTKGISATTSPSTGVVATPYTSLDVFELSLDLNSTSGCGQNPSTPDFCPGIGCVSLVTDEAHCGACSHVCIHKCLRGECVCPDLTMPSEMNECDNNLTQVDCVSGYYTRNGFRVCAPVGQPSGSTPSTPASFRSSTTRPAVLSGSSATQIGLSLFPGTVVSVVSSDSEPTDCPPSLPDVCDGICFNTEREHNHCGGCGRSCSGTCIAGSCLASSTDTSPQVASTRHVVITKGLPVTTPARPTSMSTAQPVVAYIWRVLAGR